MQNNDIVTVTIQNPEQAVTTRDMTFAEAMKIVNKCPLSMIAKKDVTPGRIYVQAKNGARISVICAKYMKDNSYSGLLQFLNKL